MKGFFHFLQYNNTLPIAVAIVFVGTGTAFAAVNPDAFVSETKQVVQQDNTFLLSSDISQWDFDVKILSIKSDNENYLVSYSYVTIKPIEYVWREFTVTNTLKASSKELIGKDLGLFVAKQLSELITNERAYLALAQEQERQKGESVKVVVTEYSGLVGKFLDENTESFPGYIPVVDESVAPEVQETVFSRQDGPTTVSYAAQPGTSPVASKLTQNDVNAFIERRVQELLAQESSTSTAGNSDTSDPEPNEEQIAEVDNNDELPTTSTTSPEITPEISTSTPEQPDETSSDPLETEITDAPVEAQAESSVEVDETNVEPAAEKTDVSGESEPVPEVDNQTEEPSTELTE